MSDLLDFAIIGGGASGVYTAWRLANASDNELQKIRQQIGGNGPLKISVFESSHRIGGRLLSASPSKMSDNAMELGGMRYLDSQPLVKGLVEKKLKAKTYPQAVDEPGNFAYLRGRLFRQSELDQPGIDLPYDLTEAEKMVVKEAKTPAQLIFWAVYQEFPEIQEMAKRKAPPKEVQDFLKSAEVDGKPLYDVGFWNLLSRHLSQEGRELGITAIGYDVLGANANAVDIIAENFDFTPDSKYFLFDEGYEAVLWELEDQFKAKGGTVHLGVNPSTYPEPPTPPPPRKTTLESFDSVDLEGGAGVELELTFESGDTVRARAIVLAMPQAALKALRKKGPLLDPHRAPHVPLMLNSVEGIPLYKLFVIYDTPWWNEKWGLKQGRSLTDIPVRQCYYWATHVGAPSAIMAYNDQASTSFWGGYQTGPRGPRDTGQRFMGALEGPRLYPQPDSSGAADEENELVKRRRQNWDDHKAPHEMVMEMHRQLLEMHGVKDAPEPVDAAFMDWMNPPYGGAVHFWNPGYKSWELREEMTQPVEGLNAFIVGEAYSTVQTWVEGAFQTSEIFLQKRMGMAMPWWVCDGGLGS